MNLNSARVISLCLVFVYSVSHADENTKVQIATLDYYTVGMNAYKDHDYLTALKYLFAYRAKNHEDLKGKPVFLKTIDNAIKFCEEELERKLKRPDIPHLYFQGMIIDSINKQKELYSKRMEEINLKIEVQALQIERLKIKRIVENQEKASKVPHG